MAGEWQETTLGEICELRAGSVFPPALQGKPTGKYPFAKVSDMNLPSNAVCIHDANNWVDDADLGHLRTKPFPAGTTVFAKIGEALKANRLRFVVRPTLIDNNMMGAVPVAKNVDPRFIFYALSQFDFAEVAGGTALPYLTASGVSQLELSLPPLDEQRAIAHILGTLDDKIELNRRMSETLEAMARAIFKAWFVDFLPVRAKMAAKANDPSLLLPQAEAGTCYVYAIECNDGSLYIGQTEDLRQRWLQHVGGKGASWTKTHPPVNVPYWEKQPSREAAVERENWLKTGYGRKWLKKEIAARTQTGAPPAPACAEASADRHLYDLFPDRLVDSELGEIPEGWEVGNLGEVAEHPRRNARPEEIDSQTPYIALEHMPKRCISLFDWGIAEGLESNKFKFQKGEILFGKLRPYFHKVGVAPVDGVCSTDIVVVIPRRPAWFGFVLGHISSVDFVEYTNAGSTGTKMPRTSWADMARYEVVLPPEPVAAAFTGLVEPLIERIIHSIYDSRTLAALRDALLPKLISGELRVKDAERFLKERGL